MRGSVRGRPGNWPFYRDDCESEASHNLNRLLDKPAGFGVGIRSIENIFLDFTGSEGLRYPEVASASFKVRFYVALAATRAQALTRFGIYKIVRRHTACLAKRGSDGELLSISPHIFRHTAAVHLLESGVEPNVIRAWLGHVSLETTNRYAEITTTMKEAALRACQAPTQAGPASHEKPIWRDDPSLLKWLQSL